MSDITNSGVAQGAGQKEKFNFYVPDFYRYGTLYAMLADFIEHIPQWFYDDFKISAVYGSFPNCIWNGGRSYYGAINRPVMQKTIEELNKRGIAVRYTFTNPLLEEKHMSDIFSNICLELGDNGQNEVLVNTQVIEDYVRKNYPSYKIISSTTKCLRTFDLVEKELEKDYYLVVLDSALNKDERVFTLKERGRLELLLDHGCRMNCPNREKHYVASGIAQLTYDEPKFPACPYVLSHKTFAELMQTDNFITREEMTDKYFANGIKHFKLDGRSFQVEKYIDSVLYYMVKPEYREQFKGIIKKEVFLNGDVW